MSIFSAHRGRHARHGSSTGWGGLACAFAYAVDRAADLKRPAYQEFDGWGL